jgi:UDP:flavonoid glycosyltransferase YjiC (YdhE family)
MNVSVVCVMPGAPAHWCDRHNSQNVTILTMPTTLDTAMQAADLVISHGSAGMVCEALLAGKPQLLVPLDAEKALITRKVTATKAARGLMPDSVGARAGGELESLLWSGEAKSAATAVAHRYTRVNWATRLDRMLSHGNG